MAKDLGELARFCVVGTIGFIADAGLTLAFTQGIRWAPLPSRALAFLVAATITWWLNRRFTFRYSAGSSTWLPYVLLTAVGALINVGLYGAWLSVLGSSAVNIVIGVAIGSLGALVFNFLVSRKWIFRK